MNTINISDNTIEVTPSGAEYILLGDSSVTQSTLLKSAIAEKVSTQNHPEMVPGIWGTLGLPNDKALNFKGSLSVSKYGNDFSTGETLKQIEGLYDINPLLDNSGSKVTERFINFDDVDFENFKLEVTKDEVTGEVKDNIPLLRLTVFVNQDEGALVFYEHSKGRYNEPGDASAEYILPLKEDMINRDRITYVFPILPKEQITEKDGVLSLGVTLHKSFVVKVLTFKRQNAGHDNAASALKGMMSYANTNLYDPSFDGESSKYKLWRYNSVKNEFEEVGKNNVSIDVNLKTLFLFHGTFATTEISFGGLKVPQERYAGLSWLQKTIQTEKYGQILAFDHPTVSEDAQQNVEVLFKRLSGYDFSHNPVDIITTSRGGLVGKYLICLSSNSTLPVNKAALIACANGVGYFVTGAYIGKLLGAFRGLTVGNPIGSIILAIAQFSVETFLKMPGCQLMTPNSERLNQILSAQPLAINQHVRFQPIVGDWDKLLVDNYFKRIAEQGLDLIIRTMLGKENDWVVNTGNQKILPGGYEKEAIEVKSLHTTYLYYDKTIGDVQQHLDGFL